ncbi:MAG: endolytic transglycosylase MltG, partial [Elioraea sp.]|nr:endolytic transglycosylase MltG [Elioraea sp.]
MDQAPVRRGGRRVRALLGLAAATVLIAAAGVAAWRAGLHLYRAPGPLAEERAVVIPRGASPAAIAERLREAGILDALRAAAFVPAARLTDAAGPLRAGEYAFPARVSLGAALDILRTAPPVQRRLTIPEGLTVAQILALLDRAEGLTGTVSEVPPEGSLLPETWAYSWGDTRDSL